MIIDGQRKMVWISLPSTTAGTWDAGSIPDKVRVREMRQITTSRFKNMARSNGVDGNGSINNNAKDG